MIRVSARYRDQKLELDHPIGLQDGAEVVIDIYTSDDERDEWKALGIDRLEAEWDNPEDAVYDDWRRLYGLDAG